MLSGSGFPGSCLLLSLLLMACSPLPGGPQAPPEPSPPPPPRITPAGPPPTIVGKSAIVIDAVTGRILAGKNEDQQRAVASTQKLMTALLVLEAGPLDDPITIATVDTAVEPTKLYLRPGETYTRGALLKAILVRSANDASLALARDVSGSKEAFAVKMNQRARSLGMMNTHFKNPHGLTEEGQFSTARDIAKLARAAYRKSFIRSAARLPEYVFSYPDGRTRTLTNTNKLLKRLSYATGLKTGTTKASGKCLVSSAELNGRVAIAVVLGSNQASIWSDSEKLLRWALEIPQPAGP